jgi:NAD(P)-dependent dehydrogenase (short-subunit alcohol dehydrogenase family)
LSAEQEALVDLKLRGKRALVTGSSREIGRAIALSLADFEVDVAINYLRNRSRAEETARDIEDWGVRCLLLKGNVANTVVYLCTEFASMIHGQIIVVDGGYSIVA